MESGSAAPQVTPAPTFIELYTPKLVTVLREEPGVADLFKRYQARAAAQGTDALGHGYVPFGYAAGQVIAQVGRERPPLVTVPVVLAGL